MRDVQLVWDNCRAYNPAGDAINQACDQAREAFELRWVLQGLPAASPSTQNPKPKKASRVPPPDPSPQAQTSPRPRVHAALSDVCVRRSHGSLHHISFEPDKHAVHLYELERSETS